MRTSDYIKRAILKYENQGGETRASSEASGVTSSKVQVRDVNGNLLAEYDKADFLKQTANTPNNGVQILQRFVALWAIVVIAVVGRVLYQVTNISNSPSTPSSTENGGGVESGGGFNPFREKVQKRVVVLVKVNREVCWSMGSNTGCTDNGISRDDAVRICLENQGLGAIRKEQFDEMLNSGASIVGSPTNESTTNIPIAINGVNGFEFGCITQTYIVEQ